MPAKKIGKGEWELKKEESRKEEERVPIHAVPSACCKYLSVVKRQNK
jgi:hypothetical protein